jgi:hypothetical protein
MAHTVPREERVEESLEKGFLNHLMKFKLRQNLLKLGFLF